MLEQWLQLGSICKSFGPVRILDNVTMGFQQGEVHVLAGENGAGKSTLIRVLSGVYTDYSGQIQINGEIVRFANPLQAAAAGISVIHQELSLVDSMSVVENMMLGREPSRLSGLCVDWKILEKKALSMCQRIGLNFNRTDLYKEAGSFPISVKTRIEIAKALSLDAKMLVMDEPTSALNQIETKQLFQIINDLRENGCCIVYISHKMEEIYQLADRISVLRNGQYILTEDASRLPEKDLISAMIGRDHTSILHPAEKQPHSIQRATTQPAALSVNSLTVTHPVAGRPDMVHGFDLQLQPGEIVGLAGLQGSGCSEVLQALFGLHGSRTTGTLKLDNQPFRPRNPGDSIRNGLALLTADRKRNGQVPAMSVASNINLAIQPRLSPAGILSPSRERKNAQHWIDRFQIRASSPQQLTGTLSGGNQQKVILAKWLSTAPKVLLLDEPTRGVDVGAKAEIYRLIRQCAAEGMSILLISTEMPELIALADRILVLHRGKIHASMTSAEANAERILSAAMGGNV